MNITSPRFGRIELPDAVIDYLIRFKQPHTAPETGGALGGYFRRDNTLVISHVMPPSQRSEAGFSWFKRHRGDAQIFVNTVFTDSGGAANYAGEWHTHPEPFPEPSGHDRKMMKDLLKRSKLEIDFLVGVIVGNTGRLCVWLQDKSGYFAIALASRDDRER